MVNFFVSFLFYPSRTSEYYFNAKKSAVSFWNSQVDVALREVAFFFFFIFYWRRNLYYSFKKGIYQVIRHFKFNRKEVFPSEKKKKKCFSLGLKLIELLIYDQIDNLENVGWEKLLIPITKEKKSIIYPFM